MEILFQSLFHLPAYPLSCLMKLIKSVSNVYKRVSIFVFVSLLGNGQTDTYSTRIGTSLQRKLKRLVGRRVTTFKEALSELVVREKERMENEQGRYGCVNTEISM